MRQSLHRPTSCGLRGALIMPMMPSQHQQKAGCMEEIWANQPTPQVNSPFPFGHEAGRSGELAATLTRHLFSRFRELGRKLRLLGSVLSASAQREKGVKRSYDILCCYKKDGTMTISSTKHEALVSILKRKSEQRHVHFIRANLHPSCRQPAARTVQARKHSPCNEQKRFKKIKKSKKKLSVLEMVGVEPTG